VFEAAEKIQIVAADGTQKSCDSPPKADISVTFHQTESPSWGRMGGAALLSIDCTAKDASLPTGVLSPSGLHGATLGDKKADGGVRHRFFLTEKNQQEVTLRSASSRPLHDAALIDWMDEGMLRFTAFQADALDAVSVATTR